jgi:hypothetical protein
VPAGVEVAEKAINPAKQMADMAEQVRTVAQALPKDLQAKLAQELARGRGKSR